MIAMMREAKARGARPVMFHELALITSLARWRAEGKAEIERWFETDMPSADTRPLFEAAVSLGIGFHLGYADLTLEGRRFNTAILVDERGAIIGKYRKIHPPGHREREPWRRLQHLEKNYFERGDLSFGVHDGFDGKVGMCIGNNRRWPETWRVPGLGGAQLVVPGCNTPFPCPPAPEHDHLQYFHTELSVQASCCQTGMWAVSVAKAGLEERCAPIGGSLSVGPAGEGVARASTVEDELIPARVDLDRHAEIGRNIFNFSAHREPEDYQPITRTKG